MEDVSPPPQPGSHATADQLILQAMEAGPVAGPSTTPSAPAAPRRVYRQKPKKVDGMLAYTVAHVPGMYNIKNPAGEFAQRDSNIEVFRQISQAKARSEKEQADEEKKRLLEEGTAVPDVHPLSNILIVHPGSRNLRIGRASDFYPKEIPNCIARPGNAVHRGSDPPVPGSRLKRITADVAERRAAKRMKVDTVDDGTNGVDDEPDVDPVDVKIGHLREYLQNRLRQNKLATDYRDGLRVKATNAKVKPEPIPDHNDPYRIDWTEVDGKQYFTGIDALRLPPSSGFRVRYPIINRTLNIRDWKTTQSLLDDIYVILRDGLLAELGISPREYSKMSVILIVPDFGDRTYVESMTQLLMTEMGFKEIAVHQEAYCAIFGAGLSSACVVDIGATSTSVTCVDEGLINSDTRVQLAYGGDDITSAMTAILQRSAFPYKELDLARSQDWLMMDNLKIKICTLEAHLVASTPWDFYVLKPEGLTDKYVFRTYDENILAPLCLFDTRMIDFEEKKLTAYFKPWNQDTDVTDLLWTSYNEPSGAMRACTHHLLPPVPVPAVVVEPSATEEDDPVTNGDAVKLEVPSQAPSADSTPAPPPVPAVALARTPSGTPTPAPPIVSGQTQNGLLTSAPAETLNPAQPYFDFFLDSTQSPLDAAITSSISMGVTDNKVKVAASNILLIGGSSALKGIGAFIAERLPPLLRAKHLPIEQVVIVPPPRNLNPRFVSWKGASVMCNLESLGDMWIRRDEWEAIGARALKDRCLFL